MSHLEAHVFKDRNTIIKIFLSHLPRVAFLFYFFLKIFFKFNLLGQHWLTDLYILYFVFPPKVRSPSITFYPPFTLFYLALQVLTVFRTWQHDNCSFVAKNNYLPTPANPYLFTTRVGELQVSYPIRLVYYWTCFGGCWKYNAGKALHKELYNYKRPSPRKS